MNQHDIINANIVTSGTPSAEYMKLKEKYDKVSTESVIIKC